MVVEKIADAEPKRDAKLLILAVRHLGEGVTAEPAIRHIRRRCPGALLAVLAEESLVNLFQLHVDVDRLIPWKAAVRSTARMLRPEKFDIGILLRRSDDLLELAERAKIWNVVCAEPEEPPAKVNQAVWGLKSAGVKEPDPERHHGRVVTSRQDREYAAKLLGKARRSKDELTIALHVGSVPPRRALSWLGKGLAPGRKLWPLENYASLAKRFMDELGARVVLVGGRSDMARSRRLVSLVGKDVLNACGLTTPRQLAELLRKCDLLVSGDSGPMHVAAAAGTSVVALYGPTSPELTGPFAPRRTYSIVSVVLECSPCGCSEGVRCPDNRCMKLIAVDDVLMAAALQLDRAKYHRRP